MVVLAMDLHTDRDFTDTRTGHRVGHREGLGRCVGDDEHWDSD
jgi:hypothetical protein